MLYEVITTTILMSFVTTVIFFAVAGPLALVLGAGRSLGEKGDVLGLSLLDIFTGSLSIFGSLGVLLVFVMFAPGLTRKAVHKLAELVSRRSRRVAERIEGVITSYSIHYTKLYEPVRRACGRPSG